MTDIAHLNFQAASALVAGCAGAGAAWAVLSPGSRSTPLALACARQPCLKTRIQQDERSAAFLALGLAKASGSPVILVATSGSAPAHWYPAVIEAHHAGAPLILLSADRPPEALACGANQTTDQLHLFGVHVRAFHALPLPERGSPHLAWLHRLGAKAAQQSLLPFPGPVHLNCPFREPLVPEREMAPLPALPGLTPSPTPVGLPDPAQLERVAQRIAGRPGLIVCGEDHYPQGFATRLARLASALRVPVLADPLSGLRRGDHDRSLILSRYDAFLRRPAFAAGHRPQWVLRFGAQPVSKVLAEYLQAQPAPEMLLVDPWDRWLDPLHLAVERLPADPGRVCEGLLACEPEAAPSAWQEAWKKEEARAGRLLEVLGGQASIERHVVERLAEQLPAGSTLFVGNSMPVRDVDSFLTCGASPLNVVGNRGVSGIDGHVSTVLGLAQAAPGKVAGLIGDLAFCHDLNGLLAAGGVDALLVVVNNGGGGIFGYLPQQGLPEFERLWLTPPGLDLEQAARLYHLPFWRADSPAGFDAALAEALAGGGVRLIEVMVDRNESIARHRAWWAKVAEDD